MQAKLPDINAALVTHRKAAMLAYDRNDFNKAGISFEAIISLLPEDYKPEINTDKYEQMIKSQKKITCRECKKETEFDNIRSFQMLLSTIDSLISRSKTMNVWQCPNNECKSVQPIEGSEIKTIEYTRPFYTKVIPEPPRREGLHDRIGFDGIFKKWYDIAFREIENQIGKYRTDYASQSDEAVPYQDEEEDEK